MKENSSNIFEIIVIGGGPGGYVAAARSAHAGKKTALIEADRLGGICLNWGCIPTKTLLRSAEVYSLISRAGEFGVTAENTGYSWGDIIARSRETADRLAKGVEFLMKQNRVTVFHSRGELAGEGRVFVEGEPKTELVAENIILATGVHPNSIPGVVIDKKNIITSREALELKTCPESLVIVGAGAIGIEFASFFTTFGTSVTIIEILDRILPGTDDDISKRLTSILRRKGIDIKTSTAVEKIETTGGTCRLKLNSGEEILCEKVLIAAGVSGNIGNIGLETAGVACERGFIKVDSSFSTTAPDILAVGDCIGPPLLAHAASMEAERAVNGLLGNDVQRLDPRLVPFCIYGKPNAAGVGLTEQAAREEGYDITIGKIPFRGIGQAQALGEPDGFVKVIINRSDGRFLGAHIIGAGAPEILQEIVLAMHVGATAGQLLKTIHPHPTLSEAVREAVAGALENI